MKRIVKIFAVIAVLGISFSSCKKYEEGPGLRFRSKKARVEGEWTLSTVSENGVDQPQSSDDLDDIYKFTKDGKMEFQDPGNATISGTWKFDSKKEKVTLSFSFSGQAFTQVTTILKLKNNELKWEYTDGTDKYIETYTK